MVNQKETHLNDSTKEAVKVSIPNLYLINPGSIAKPNAFEHLQADMISYGIDIVLIVESWLKSQHQDKLFSIPGFDLFRRDRVKRKGGGVSVYTRSEYNARIYVPGVFIDRMFELFWIQLKVNNELIYIGTIYHPPKPIYKLADLLKILEECIEEIMSRAEDSTIVLAGDFHQIPDSDILSLGLVAQFNGPTHCGHGLDRIYASKQIYGNCVAVQSTINTAHKAVVARADEVRIYNKGRQVQEFSYRRRTPGQHATMMSSLVGVDWTEVMNPDVELQSAFDLFYDRMKDILNQFYPIKRVKVSNMDPAFVTPDIKLLLRKKNSLMRKGKTKEAGRLALLIGKKITTRNSRLLTGKLRGSKDLWDAVNETLGKTKSRGASEHGATAEELNAYFGGISHDRQYVRPEKKLTVADRKMEIFTEEAVFTLLDHLGETSPGLDELPAWFLRGYGPIHFSSDPSSI